MKKSCLSLILATSMIMANFSTSVIAHKPLEKIIQVKGMSYDDVISDALRAKLNGTSDYIDCMVYFKDDTSNEDIQKLSKTIKTEESKDDKDRKAVIAQLSQTAIESQNGILDWLEEEKESGNVKNYEGFYIINAIHLKAKANLIEKLASYPKVDKIDVNQKIQAENPVDKQPSKVESDRDEIEWNLKNIGADLAWNQGIRGQGVTIGIMDSAVDANHPALKRKFKGYDQSSDRVNFNDSNYFDAIQGKQDTSGVLDMAHGSHCTGIVLGSELNSNGEEFNRIGVAPDAQWINARIFDSNYKNVEQSSFIKAAEWMLAPGNDPSKAPQIINNSWGGSQYLTDTWFKSTVDRWRQAHILPVFAAGNQMPGESLPGESSIVIPASYPESFAVGAVDIMGNLASFSKRGPSLFDTSLIKPEISAPGVKVRSSIKDTYAYMSGTSMAAPHVAGVAALVKSAKQNLDDREIQKILEETATPRTDSYYKTTPNNGYGYGIVNAYAAVVKAMDKEIGTIRGRVMSDGKPIEAEISVEGTDIKVKSNSSSGEFFLVYPSEGDIKISCKAFGYNSIDKTIKINKENTTHVDFDMIKKPTRNLEGSVSDKSGTKLSDVNVYLVEDATTEIELTGDNGRFSIKDVPVGEYTLRAFKHGYKFYEKKVMLDENSSDFDISLEDKNNLGDVELYYDNGKENESGKNQIVGINGDLGVAVSFKPKKKATLSKVKVRFASDIENTGTSAMISVVKFDSNKRIKTLLMPVKVRHLNVFGDTEIDLEKYNIQVDGEYYVLIEPDYDTNKSIVVALDRTASNMKKYSYQFDRGYFRSYDTLDNKKGALMIRSVLSYDEGASDIDYGGQDDDQKQKVPDKDKEPEKDKEPKKDKEPEKDKGPKKDKEPEKDKEPKKDKEPEKDKEPKKDKEPEKEKEPKKDKEIEKDKEPEKDKESEKDKEPKKNKESEKEHEKNKDHKNGKESVKDNKSDSSFENDVKKAIEDMKKKDELNEKKEDDKVKENKFRSAKINRISGNNRISTAINLSRNYFDHANTLVLVNSKEYPDSLTAAPLAKALKAPILLNDSNRLDIQVKNEIRRLGVNKVILVGGNNSLSIGLERDLKNMNLELNRIAGKDRYDTSARLAKQLVKLTGYSDRAIVASGENFPDALTASSIAAKDDLPVLLVKSTSVPYYIDEVMKDMGIKKTILVGGNKSIGKNIESELRAEYRIAGKNRYETANLVRGYGYKKPKKIFLTTGESFADALVSSPLAAMENAPIQLLNPKNNSDNYIDLTSRENIEDIIVLGGEKSIPEHIVDFFINIK